MGYALAAGDGFFVTGSYTKSRVINGGRLWRPGVAARLFVPPPLCGRPILMRWPRGAAVTYSSAGEAHAFVERRLFA
jgi:hypothetical protein